MNERIKSISKKSALSGALMLLILMNIHPSLSLAPEITIIMAAEMILQTNIIYIRFI